MGRDEVLKQCSGTRHPSSSPVMGRARVGVNSSGAVISCLGGDGVECHRKVEERDKESVEEEKNKEMLCERENMPRPLSHEKRLCNREKDKRREGDHESLPP